MTARNRRRRARSLISRNASLASIAQHTRVLTLRLARLTLVAALALVALGGVVHTTGSSLACPDWPLCQGLVMPPMVGGILFEHSHRLLALAVLSMVIALPFTLRARPGARRLAWLGAGLVIVQALLGATTVLLRLPPPVSIAHLLCATALLGILLRFSLAPAPSIAVGAPTQTSLDLAIGAVLAQIGLGALVRHFGAGLACGTDVILCDGSATPEHPAAWLHVAHRALGVVVAVLVGLAAYRALRDPALPPRARQLSLAAVALVLAQIALGLLTVAAAIELTLVTSHLVVAELLFLTLLAIRLRIAAPYSRGVTITRPVPA